MLNWPGTKAKAEAGVSSRVVTPAISRRTRVTRIGAGTRLSGDDARPFSSASRTSWFADIYQLQKHHSQPFPQVVGETSPRGRGGDRVPPPRLPCELGLLDLDFLCRFLSLSRFWQRDGQHSLREIGGDLVAVDARGQLECPLERAVRTLGEMIVLVLLFLFLALFASEDEHVTGNRRVDVLGVNPRQLGRDFVCRIVFAHVDCWRGKGEGAAPRRFD